MTFTGTLKNAAYVALFLILVPLIPVLIGGIQKVFSRYFDPRVHVGVLPVKGLICDSGYYVKQLHTFFEDDSIKAILLKIECPGSATGTGQAIFQEIMSLKGKYPKPVIALTENVCASGGYYIASASDHIIASPMAMVGSIGVTIPYYFQVKDLVERHHIKYISLKAGEYKNAGNPFDQLTDTQKKMLQGMVDDSYDIFAQDIASRRSLDMAKIKEWADGQIFTGRQALKLKLVDELGGSFQAISYIKQIVNTEHDVKWVNPPSKASIWNWLAGDSDECNDSIFSSAINELCSVVESRYANLVMQ